MSETIHATPQFKGKLYGVELEIECEGLYQREEHFNSNTEEYEIEEPCVPLGWLYEQEDSIVGVELISDKPYTFEQQVENIERVFKDIERQGHKPIRTPRGSTHVHANVADLTWDQMKHFITACAWCEPVLIELAGKGRKGNLFAQSYDTTPVGWAMVIAWMRWRELRQNVDTHYMATSFHPLTYLGSVEFRMGPSARNADEAIRWLEYIDAVVTCGREEQVTDVIAPKCLSNLLSFLPSSKQYSLWNKGAKAASEVWHAMNEPYEKPVINVKAKKTAGLIAQAQVQAQTIAQQSGAGYSLNINTYDIDTLPADQQWFVNWDTAPVPTTPSTSEPAIIGGCSDPNCTICNPN